MHDPDEKAEIARDLNTKVWSLLEAGDVCEQSMQSFHGHVLPMRTA
ncbi:hypothetical protein [Dickeya dianthicola]|nr:hypothetical protein [Dickeya dianthicola]